MTVRDVLHKHSALCVDSAFFPLQLVADTCPCFKSQQSHVLLAEHFDGLSCAQECPGRLALLLGSIYLFLVGFFTPGCSFTGLLLGSLYGLPAAFCAIATLSTLGAAINYCLSALLIKVTRCGAHQCCCCVCKQTLPGHTLPGCRPVTLCWASSAAVWGLSGTTKIHGTPLQLCLPGPDASHARQAGW